MLYRWNLALISLSILLQGCKSQDLLTFRPGKMNLSSIPQGIDLPVLEETIRTTSPGSRVRCSDSSKQHIYGTLLTKNDQQLELVNGISLETVPGPDGELQAKYSHVPWQLIELSSLTGYAVMAKPDVKRTQKELQDEIQLSSVESIVLKSGRLRPSPKLISTNASRDSIKNIQITVDATLRGSEILIVDEFDRSYQGIFSSSSFDELELINCVSKETVPSRNGQLQHKTSYVPFQSFTFGSIKSFVVLSPPEEGYTLPAIQEEPAEFCFDDFVCESGRHLRRGNPLKCNPAPRGKNSTIVE